MKTLTRTLALVGVAALGALVIAQQTGTDARVRLAPGQAAPAFTLPDLNGKSHNLTDYKGKYVVLEWTNHQCPFVVKHYQNGDMQATQKWAKDKGVVWLTILSSAPGKQGYLDAAGAKQVWEQQKKQATAQLLDPAGTVGRAYGARTTPHMYVIDPAGKLIYIGAIDDNRSSNPADVKGARNHVREALTEALAGKPVSLASTQPYGCSVKYPD